MAGHGKVARLHISFISPKLQREKEKKLLEAESFTKGRVSRNA